MHINGVEASGGVMIMVALGTWMLTIIVHIAFAVGVVNDAEGLDKTQGLKIVGPWMWFLATLLGGVFVAAAYWLMHHSRLNPKVPLSLNDQFPATE